MNRISTRLRTAAALAGMLAATTGGLLATAGPASAAGGSDGVLERICHAEGLYLRDEPKPDGHALDHLEDGWQFQISHHADRGMVYGYSPRLNTRGYVIDGYFC